MLAKAVWKDFLQLGTFVLGWYGPVFLVVLVLSPTIFFGLILPLYWLVIAFSGPDSGPMIWHYFILQLLTIIGSIYLFSRKKGTKGITYLENYPPGLPEESGQRTGWRYRLPVGLSLALLFLLLNEFLFCSIFDTCLTLACLEYGCVW